MFSNKIKELRKEHKMTQMKFADVLHISSGTIAMWETGKRTPDIEKIHEIADQFNVSVDWLTGKSEFKNNNEVGEYYSGWGSYDPFFDPPFEFCSLLKDIYRDQDYLIDDMAEAIGVTAVQYLEYEEGTAPITYIQAEKLCSFLGTNVSQVLFDNDHYDGEVPEEYHNDVRSWERMKQASENEAIKESYAGVTIDYILGRDNEDMPEEMVILNRAAKKMTPEKRKKLLDVARTIFEEEFDD